MTSKPPDWPRYMVARRIAGGRVAYYWTPRAKDTTAGCTLHPEALGQDYADARRRADLLNTHLDAWRRGVGAVRTLDLTPAFGTLDWLVERYKRSPAWEKVSAGGRHHYSYILGRVLDMRLSSGDRLGSARIEAISARAVDRVYERLRQGGARVRVPVMCIQRMARAWDVVARLYPKAVPAANPWRGVELTHGDGTTTPATREEATALHVALVRLGHPWLAALPLICFEWLQRPTNVLDGHLTWADYRPAQRPGDVQIVHHKTGVRVWHRLADAEGPLYPELCAYLDGLERVAPAIVVAASGRHPVPRRIDHRRADAIVRAARAAAGLGSHVTLAACRHGGLTELGDAELTEQGVMALSGHRTPDAARLYVKRTETQRLVAARRRRAYVDAVSTPAQPLDMPSQEQTAKSRNAG